MGVSNKIPLWLVIWLVVASPIVLFDASFLLLRPASMAGGHLNWLFSLYNIYVEVDARYGDMEDEFGLAQAYMNLAEIVLSLLVVALHCRNSPHTRPLALLTLTMTWWKTVAYMLQYLDICNGGAYLANNTTASLIFLFLVPNGLWLVFPLLGMVSVYTSLCQAQPSTDARKKNP